MPRPKPADLEALGREVAIATAVRALAGRRLDADTIRGILVAFANDIEQLQRRGQRDSQRPTVRGKRR